MVFFSTLAAPGNLLTIVRNAVSSHNLDRRTFSLVIKTGTLLRCVVWPLVPPLMLYQYIRKKDDEYYAIELLRHRSRSTDVGAFYDPTLPGGAKHWRMQADLKIIRDAATFQIAAPAEDEA
jgi:hypothetical protein